jgi:predicted DNA-binding transcriptional regulator YafY
VIIDYQDEQGRPSSRTIWPVGLAFYEGKQTIAAWCLLRNDFRNFRTDRIVCLELTEERYGKRRVQLEKEWRASWEHDEKYVEASN